MKIGISSYSFLQKIKQGEMSIIDVIRWIADHGGEHVEIVPIGFSLSESPDLASEIRSAAKEAGIDVSNYAISANFVQPTDEEYENEVQRVMREVDIANELGVKLMRHDAAWRPIPENSVLRFDEDLPRLASACRRVAEHAARYGITTSVENHGYFVQHSDRVQRLLAAVGRENYRTTLDVGNFMCVDEDPVVSTTKNLPFASMVHLKDFYKRRFDADPGKGWLPTAGGYHLRGAILGQGDIDLPRIMRAVKDSGYDGYLSIEFEGVEDCLFACEAGMETARRLWESA